MAKVAHDGSDFKHRQKVLPQYQVMALSKQRLKFIVVLHMLLSFLMALKLLPTVLDLLNVFWQPLEELYIPMAKPWEWIWFSGALATPLAFSASKTNNTLQLKIFLLSIVSLCVMPAIYCGYYYSSDLITYAKTKDAEQTSEVWRNLPVAIYWYAFIGVTLQVHGLELYSGRDLLRSMGGSGSSSRVSSVNKSK